MNNCSIILQGKVDKECFELWIKNYSHYKIIVSVWEDENLSEYKIPENWMVVYNKYPLIRFRKIANLDYQIITTLSALEKVDTPLVIKMRCDEYWSNIEKIYDKMLKFPEKIISGSMFFRKWGMFKFHPSDKIIGGTTENLILMFKSVLNNIESNLWQTPIPESQLGFAFVYAKEKEIQLLNYSIDKIEEIDDDIIKKHLITGCDLIKKEMDDIVMSELDSNNPNWKTIFSKLYRFRNILDECIKEGKHKTLTEIDDKPYMIKWFDIIDINELKPYIATKSGFKDRIWYRSNFNNEENDCLTTLS